MLARWGGWGALWQVFDEDKSVWSKERSRLKELLSEEEYQAARLTTINAHYTDPALVAPIWGLLERLGLSQGRVLEPGCGAGTFIGMAPAGVSLTGVELDPLTASIAAALYPLATIRAESFSDTRFPAGWFDGAVGNVPFADVVLHDPRYNQARLAMHNYFIVKSLELVRPGGVVAFLTSSFTMDAVNPAARRAMAARADLIAAVRLPTGAHRRAAGTDVVTDLVVLRRRGVDEPPRDVEWDKAVRCELPGPHGPEEVDLNEYWAAHPDHVLGRLEVAVGMHGVAGLVALTGDLGQTGARLERILDAVAEEALASGLGVTARLEQAAEQLPTPVMTDELDGVILREDGSFSIVEGGQMVPLSVPKSQQVELAELLRMRDQIRSLIAAESATVDDTAELDQQRSRLAKQWRSYVDRFGPINRYTLRRTGRKKDDGEEQLARIVPAAIRTLRRDPYGTLVMALEVFDAETQSAEPAGILRERQVLPREPVHGVETAADGLAVVLDTLGRVDVDEIARLMGTDVDRALSELDGLVFEVPGGEGSYQTRAEYVSGNVRVKLRQARAAELAEPGRWSRQVSALEEVLPVDIPPGDITANLGAVWISDQDHEDFLRDLVGGRPNVRRLVGTTWQIDYANWGVQATSEWGTERCPAGTLMRLLLEQKRIAVYDKIDDKPVLNPDETAAAVEKGRLMKERFATWVWEDDARAARLAETYNEMFNSNAPRDYTDEGKRLSLPGLARTFTPRQHQRTAVARMLAEPSVGLFHPVGAGKTAEMAMGATELKRLGLIRKPGVVVPNHMLEQIAAEWLQLYPQARLLAAGSDDLAGDQRRRFVAQVATNDWDAIILTRTAFQRLPLSPENEQAFLMREIAAARDRLETLKTASGSSAALRRIEKAVLRQEERLKAMRDVPVDAGVTFEQSGIDYLLIDELHDFKNLATASQISDASIAGSKRAMDLYAKIDYLRHTQGQRVVTGATATPIANSLAEMHVMMRYLDPDTLDDLGLSDFDAWAATFATVSTSMELSVAGGTRFILKSRLASFTNVPELLGLFHRFADVRTDEDLDLPVPLVAARPDTGERQPRLVVVERSPELTRYIQDMGQRADRIAAGSVDPTQDNMLKLSSDGRKAALDMRLIDPSHLALGSTKIDAAADELAWVWQHTKDWRYLDRGTGDLSPIPGALQVVFCDLGTPGDRWNVYTALRQALAVRGLPQEKVRFIHEANTPAEQARLFQACRAGRVAVLIGSTQKMGTGVNIQDRVVHLLHLDAPWRPADVTQRNGRGIRQLNQNSEVIVTNIVTDGSFDSFMWQVLERKSRFIAQVMSGRALNREISDIGDDTLTFAEVKAVASGNPLLLEGAAAEQELQRLTRLERAHQTSQRNLEFRIRSNTREITDLDRLLPELETIQANLTATRGTAFALSSDGRLFHSRGDAADHLNDQLQRGTRPHVVLGGLSLEVDETHHMVPYGQCRWIWHAELDPTLRVLVDASRFQPQVTRGVIARLEGLVESLPTHVTNLRLRRSELEHSVDQCQRLLGKPFEHADGLRAARHRFERITAQIADIERQPPAEPRGAEHVAAVERVLRPVPAPGTAARPALSPPPNVDTGWERVQAEHSHSARQALDAPREKARMIFSP